MIVYETWEDERAFMRAVVAGLADLESGREHRFVEQIVTQAEASDGGSPQFCHHSLGRMGKR